MKDKPGIIVVMFNNGDVQTFGSVSAIYDHYNNSQIGCDLRTLYAQSFPYNTGSCVIYKTKLICKKRKN